MNESQVFADALMLAAPAERAAFLDRACAGDPRLRADVEALLRAHETDPGFLEQPAGTVDAPMAANPAGAGRPGAVIAGRYKLIEPVGEGGMGSVWMAEQQQPVRRLVAVKLIRPGMDSRQVLARFEAERQALALMDHPNIAKVLDAGQTEQGRPYFVMELVKGIPITQFCDERRLTPRERLELFIPVCQAVQHAHQKGIIHRDIKPSNVLVALYDGRPVPKVIDFGVAKAIGEKLTEATLYTGFGAVVGTPEYMSPEQAELNQLDVDTRSDIYALGVLLYELLTGTTPLDLKRLKQAAILEVLRVIREEEPQRPSTRLSTTEELPSIAASRNVEPRKLTGLVRGELDWIVMKALEKDRGRRYETANALALDVQRYLADEPVLACPPSTVYRMQKFLRRNTGAVLAISLVVLALVGGIIGTTVGLVQARQARDTAEKRLAQIEKGIDLIGSLFENLDPYAEEKEGRPLRAILGDRLDRAAAELEGEAIGDPVVVARLQERLGQSYLGLGRASQAEALFSKAVSTRLATLGADHPDTLSAMHNQARAYEAAGKRIEAIRQFEQVRGAREKILGPHHLDTLSTMDELGKAYYRAKRWAEAVPMLEQVRDGRVNQIGEDDGLTLATLVGLARAYASVERSLEAIALAEQVRDALVEKHGEDHPLAIAAMNDLAWIYQRCYRMPQAFALYRQGRDLAMSTLGPNHPQTLSLLQGVAHMHRAYGETHEAIALLEQVWEKRVIVLGDHHPATIFTVYELAMAYQGAGELERAIPLFQQAAEGAERLDFSIDFAERIYHNLAICHEEFKQYEQAESWRRRWVAAARTKFEPESFDHAAFPGLSGLGWNLIQQQKHAEAEPILRESLAILLKHHPETWERYRAQSLLGAALLGQRKYTEAEPHLVQGYRGMKTEMMGRGREYYGPQEAFERLVQLYEVWGKPDEAAKWREEREPMEEQP